MGIPSLGASTAPAVSALAPGERIEWIDAVRGIALFGVLIVNLVTEFRVSIFQQFLESRPAATRLDAFVESAVSLGLESKAFCLFALLFGIGLAMQFERLSRTGRPLYWLLRRLVALLALGLVHLLFIWNGDILTEYALAGLLALPLLLLPSPALLVAALALFALYAAGPALLYAIPWPDAAALRSHVASANRIYAGGGLAEVWSFSLRELPLLLPLHLFVFPRTLALFALGMFLWRSGIAKRPRDFGRAATLAAIFGIAAGAVLTGTGRLALLAPVLLALGYGAALMVLAQRPGARELCSRFAPLGRMAFTNYVLQSVVFGVIFFGYGLGQFGRIGAAAAFALGVAVYAAQLALSRWWLGRHRFGPLERLWRTLTYEWRTAARPS